MNKIIKKILGSELIGILDDAERVIERIGANVNTYDFYSVLESFDNANHICLENMVKAFLDCELLPFSESDYMVTVVGNTGETVVHLISYYDITEEVKEQFYYFEELTTYRIIYENN